MNWMFILCLFFFFKQKTAYEMRISDWSSDVCSSDLLLKMGPTSANQQPARFVWLLSQAAKDKLADCATGTNPDKIRKAPAAVVLGMDAHFHEHLPFLFPNKIGRAACRARVCQHG